MEIATMLLAALACVLSLASLLRRPSGGLTGEDLEKFLHDLLEEVRLTRQEMTGTPCDVPVPRKVSLAMRNDSLQVPKVAKKNDSPGRSETACRAAEEVSSEPA